MRPHRQCSPRGRRRAAGKKRRFATRSPSDRSPLFHPLLLVPSTTPLHSTPPLLLYTLRMANVLGNAFNNKVRHRAVVGAVGAGTSAPWMDDPAATDSAAAARIATGTSPGSHACHSQRHRGRVNPTIEENPARPLALPRAAGPAPGQRCIGSWHGSCMHARRSRAGCPPPAASRTTRRVPAASTLPDRAPSLPVRLACSTRRS